jgi:hypothetical protein
MSGSFEDLVIRVFGYEHRFDSQMPQVIREFGGTVCRVERRWRGCAAHRQKCHGCFGAVGQDGCDAIVGADAEAAKGDTRALDLIDQRRP